MSRNIPIQLQESLNKDATSTTYLLKISSVRDGYAPFGASLTNVPIDYNDGQGLLRYYAIVGMQPSTLLSTPDMSVDNAEVEGLLPEYEFPIKEEDILAGVYDYAQFSLYLVNYNDLSAGHALLGSGTLGRMRSKDGLSFWEELRGLSQELKQTICARDSLTCRATFGSQPKGTGGGVVEEREFCGIDLSALWQPGTVTAVGAEEGYSFTDSSLPFGSGGPEADYYALGMVRWTSGLNAGREYEVEANTVGGVVTLAFVTDRAINVGDQYEIRQGCNKVARDDVRGCKYWYGAEWVMHFRGEPDIPVGDAVKNATPGATVGPGQGGSTNIPYETEEA